MLSEQSSGVFMIAVTPFDDHGGLDLASIDRATDFYIEREVDGLTVLGMMGEAVKLTAAFYRNVAETLGADAPFALQDFPQSTGVQIAADVIERIVSELPSCVML